MGKVIHTTGLLLPTHFHWKSRYYQDTAIAHFNQEQQVISKYLMETTRKLGLHIGHIWTERTNGKLNVCFSYIPENGLLVAPQQALPKIVKNLSSILNMPIIAIQRHQKNLDAAQICSKIAYAIKQGRSLHYGYSVVLNEIKEDPRILGMRIECSGRPKKMEMATTEWIRYKNIPLHTYKHKIDFHSMEITLKYGKCNIKVHLYLN